MISERRQIAERFLSEGNGEAARIRGNRVRDLNKIQSEAYPQVQGKRGGGDAKTTEIYAGGFKQRPYGGGVFKISPTQDSSTTIHTRKKTPFHFPRPEPS